jgi:hypothetical protein
MEAQHQCSSGVTPRHHAAGATRERLPQQPHQVYGRQLGLLLLLLGWGWKVWCRLVVILLLFLLLLLGWGSLLLLLLLWHTLDAHLLLRLVGVSRGQRGSCTRWCCSAAAGGAVGLGA